MIKALSELLVESGLCLTQRAASSKIKTGKVRVSGESVTDLLVANKDALLVIVSPIELSCEGATVVIKPHDVFAESLRTSASSTDLD